MLPTLQCWCLCHFVLELTDTKVIASQARLPSCLAVNRCIGRSHMAHRTAKSSAQHSRPTSQANMVIYPCVPLLVQGTVPDQLGSLSHLQCLNPQQQPALSGRPACISRAAAQLSRACGWTTTGSVAAFLGPGAMHQSPLHCMWTTTPGLFGEVPYCLEGRLGQGRGLEGTGLVLSNSSNPEGAGCHQFSVKHCAAAAAAATMLGCCATAPPVGQSASCPLHASLDTAACSAAHCTVAVCTLVTSAVYLVACSALLCFVAVSTVLFHSQLHFTQSL